MAAKRKVLTGKGGKGYRIMAAGAKRAYLVLTIPHEIGFEKGDRVQYRVISRNGQTGVEITKIKSSPDANPGPPARPSD